MRKRLLFLMAALLMMTSAVMAQITTSGMAGRVTIEGTDEAVIGATLQVTHEPSGTHYTAVTNAAGRFSINGMRTGGPYVVKVSYIGYQPKTLSGIQLQLGETYNLSVWLSENTSELGEVVISGKASKFAAEKTGASTNISNTQLMTMPTIDRSIQDVARISPYANGMSLGGGDGRSTNFTIDGANFNNNFGLSDKLPGGGNPISMDAIEEVQVVVAPFDVRQTNFIGGGINAVTKSGTNTFKGTAYHYYRDQDMRGNTIDGDNLGARAKSMKRTWGVTLGGPIIKDKLFFFVNYEGEKSPGQVTSYRAAHNGETGGKGNVSRVTEAELQQVSDFVKQKWGYNTGSYTNFPGDEDNTKLLARIDWNITDRHHLAVRYNYTKNTAWNTPNGNSSDTGYRLNNTYRMGLQSWSFANSLYSMDNKVQSISADLNSRFSDKISNQLLFTHTNIEDMRGSDSSEFPFIDIMAGKRDDGSQILEPYMSLGYELFTYNNGVKNKITSVTDNFTLYLGKHKITAGARFEHQFANNAYMRNGTGYYRYSSVEDFLNQAAPEAIALTYGFNGVKDPNAQVTFNQLGLYLQDEFDITPKFKLTYGVRLDDMMFDNKDIARNEAIYALNFRDGQKIDTGVWPSSKMQFSPRVGFVWDVKGDKSLKVRGGSGVFTGRLPLVFFTNMPTNANMVQNSWSKVAATTYGSNGVIKDRSTLLDLFSAANGGMSTSVDEMIQKLGLPTTLDATNHTASNKVSGVSSDFKMPQIWKSSIAVDWVVPASFPLSVTGEFMFNKNINAVIIDNINIDNPSAWTYADGTTGAKHFAGADQRMDYHGATYTLAGASRNAVVLDNSSKGWGYTANLTVNAEPLPRLNLMAAYTYTKVKEISGLPGSDPVSTWQGLYSVDGPNFSGVQASQYVVPHKIVASVGYTIPARVSDDKVLQMTTTHINLFYTGQPYISGNGAYQYVYSNDMNGDGISNDLIYIPANDAEINFVDYTAKDGSVVYSAADQRKDFWEFVNQDNYLKNHKGEYAEAYSVFAPWYHRFDLRLAQDVQLKWGKTMHKFQVSFDAMNIGQMLNSKWGVYKTNAVANNGAILSYVGTDAQNVPQFQFYRDSKTGSHPTQSFDYYRSYTQCWQVQFGVKYFFN